MFNFINQSTIIHNIPLGNMFVKHGMNFIHLHLTYDAVFNKFFFEEIDEQLFDSQYEAILFVKETVGEPHTYIEYCGGSSKHPERFVKLEKEDFEKIT